MYFCTRIYDLGQMLSLKKDRDLAQLVAHTSGGREVAGSSPVIPTKGKSKPLIISSLDFFMLYIGVFSAESDGVSGKSVTTARYLFISSIRIHLSTLNAIFSRS